MPGVFVYELDTVNGKLTKICSVANVLNPAYLVSGGRGTIYVCTEARVAGGGKLRSYRYANGKLSLISEVSSEGENPVYLTTTADEQLLIAANYSGGTIAAFKLDSGRIEAAGQVILFKDSSVNKERQESAHPHAAVLSSHERYLYVPDLGADKIRYIPTDATNAQPLNPDRIRYINTAPGGGPRHIVFSSGGKYAYCTEEMAGVVSVYRLSANGRLDSCQRLKMHDGRVDKQFSSGEIHISEDGRFLYAANRGDENNIAIMSIDQLTGKLSVIGYCSVRGDHPRSFTIDPSGKFLLVANQLSNNVTVFRRDANTGLLKYAGKQIRIPGASCVRFW